jgi:hypothetical protein
MGARYEWDRFAAATTPRLPGKMKASDRIRIPWPKRPERPKYERMFVPPFLSHALHCRSTENGSKLLYTPQKLKT